MWWGKKYFKGRGQKHIENNKINNLKTSGGGNIAARGLRPWPPLSCGPENMSVSRVHFASFSSPLVYNYHKITNAQRLN